MSCGSSPRTSAGASCRWTSTPRRSSARSIARICGAQAAKNISAAAADIPKTHLARQGDLLRRQGVRSRRSQGLPRLPPDQEGGVMAGGSARQRRSPSRPPCRCRSAGTSAEIVAFQPPMRPVLERAGEIARHVAERGAAAADRARDHPVRLAAPVLRAGRAPAAADQGGGRRLGLHRRSVLRQWRHRQGRLLADLQEPGPRRHRLQLRRRGRHRAGRADRPEHLGDARPRSDLPGPAHRAAARLAAAVAGGLPRFRIPRRCS